MKWLRLLLPVVLLAAFGAVTTAWAQNGMECTEESWIAVGGGLSGEAVKALVKDGKLYVIHKTGIAASSPRDTNYRISAWDGAAWTKVTDMTITTDSNFAGGGGITSFVEYKGDLYISGRFRSVNKLPDTVRVARWDGATWSNANIGIPKVMSVSAMAVHDGKLYAAYISFGSSQRMVQYGVTAWDGSSWSKAGELMDGDIYALTSWKGALYAGGRFSTVGKTHTGGIARWNGASWESLGNTVQGIVESMVPFNNELFIAGEYLSYQPSINGAILRWNGSAFSNGQTTFDNWMHGFTMEVHNNQLYIIGRDDSIFVEPNVWGITRVKRFDGATWHSVSNFDRQANFLVEYDGMLYAGGGFNASCGSKVDYIAQICDDKSCSRISGNIYWDKNGDCAMNGDDKGVTNRMIEILPGPSYASTDADGNYSLYVLPGSYTVGLAPYLHWRSKCPASGSYNVDLSNPGKGSSGNDFGTEPIPNIQDLRVSVTTGPVRAGRTLLYAITYTNAGTMTMNGTVSFFYDDRLTFDSSAPQPSRVQPSLLQWDFTNLEMGESRTIRVYMTVPRSATIGDRICGMVKIDPQVEELSRDNRDTICVPVTGGYDPNDMRVTPTGFEDNGEIAPSDTVLTYYVRFQNTGNDTAFKVVVVDTLSPTLDPKTIVLGASSHPFTFGLSGNGVLAFTFDNIMLPDSGANEPNSHGFFKYSARLRPALPGGTQIVNRASIYFDYNDPVQTNAVLSVITAPSSVTTSTDGDIFSLFPNPAHGLLYLTAEMAPGTRVAVMNALGQTLRTFSYDGSGRMEMNVTDLPSGAYWIAIPTTKGMKVERVTVVR